ncbi:MAG: hypothetical protein ABIL46_08465 [candidate division WOR-3 bacterium]
MNLFFRGYSKIKSKLPMLEKMLRKVHKDIFGCDVEQLMPGNSLLKSELKQANCGPYFFKGVCKAVFRRKYSYRIYYSDWCVLPSLIETGEYEYDYLNLHLNVNQLRLQPFTGYADGKIIITKWDDWERQYSEIIEKNRKLISLELIESVFKKAQRLVNTAVDFWNDTLPANDKTQHIIELREQRKKLSRYSSNINAVDNQMIWDFGISSCGVDEDNNYFLSVLVNPSWERYPQFEEKIAKFIHPGLASLEKVPPEYSYRILRVEDEEDKIKLLTILTRFWLQLNGHTC